MSRLENILSYAKDAYEIYRDSDLVSIDAEVLIALLRCKGFIKANVLPTSVLTNEFNLYREATERWKTIQVGRVMSRLGFRPKRTQEGRSGWVIDKSLLNKLLHRYNITEANIQEKLI